MSARVPRDLTPGRNPPEVEAAFEAAPPEMVAEILDGELFTFPRPARPHTRSASRLTMKLGGAFDLGDSGPGGWVILDEPELHLGPRPDKLAPDLAAWKREMRIYRRESVGHVWLLSPLMRTLEVYWLEGGRWVLLETYEDDAKVRAEPFDAVELDLAAIWAR